MPTTVANIRDGIPLNSVYIGRAGRGFDGKWGNPIMIGAVVQREQALDQYRHWLSNRLIMEPDFLEPLRNKTLLCFCKPLACHGDVIKEFLDEAPLPIAKTGWAFAQRISDRADPNPPDSELTDDEWLVEPPYIKGVMNAQG